MSWDSAGALPALRTPPPPSLVGLCPAWCHSPGLAVRRPRWAGARVPMCDWQLAHEAGRPRWAAPRGPGHLGASGEGALFQRARDAGSRLPGSVVCRGYAQAPLSPGGQAHPARRDQAAPRSRTCSGGQVARLDAGSRLVCLRPGQDARPRGTAAGGWGRVTLETAGTSAPASDTALVPRWGLVTGVPMRGGGCRGAWTEPGEAPRERPSALLCPGHCTRAQSVQAAPGLRSPHGRGRRTRGGVCCGARVWWTDGDRRAREGVSQTRAWPGAPDRAGAEQRAAGRQGAGRGLSLQPTWGPSCRGPAPSTASWAWP
ncbi:uncharacterized protein LOC129399320 [Sorex araneus]|uniref:uncharacterized protein LOC129399320 n=1 Tax=Sorex araneus TaxID=42254 RepID=UPI0024339C23|nr:uncharacterized protein LOC129399320 [Sorex araneus]